MNLEAMFFPSANINHQFDEIVMACAELINTYTVESSFDAEKVKRYLVKNKGQIRADLHNSGNVFQFEFYEASFVQEFKIDFSGEGQLLKIVYEIDSSNPSGHLTLFTSDSTTLLTKEVREMLKRVSDNASEKIIPKTSSEKAQTETIEKISETNKVEIHKEQISKDPAAPIRQKMNCKCPNKQSEILPDKHFLIEHFSDKVTRHFHHSGPESLTIYQCKYCETYLIAENLAERSGKVNSALFYIDAKTANYLLDISDQLKSLIDEKGISVVRQIISGSEI